MIAIFCGVCSQKLGPPGLSRKAGTPVGQQRASRAYIALPPRTSSFDFFSESFANWVRFGLPVSATLKVACLPVLLPTHGWAGSQPVGCGPPGTPAQSVPMVTQPALPAEKSGGRGLSCAEAGTLATLWHRKPNATAASRRCDTVLAGSDINPSLRVLPLVLPQPFFFEMR